MDEHTFRVLEIEKVLGMASAFAFTAPGRSVVQRTRPLRSIDDIRRQIDLVSELRRFFSEGEHVGIEHFNDLSALFKKVRPADAVIEPFELRSFLPLFHSAINLKLLNENPILPGLAKIVSQLTAHPDIRKAIDRAIDREGKIRDEASQELSYIRKSIRSCEVRIKNMLEGILKQKDLIPFIQDFYLSERNNRWVIPVKRDFKVKVPGVVHDFSNTGETVYVEPYSVQRIGNELESYRAEEKLEEYRILQGLSSHIREHLPEIEEDFNIVAKVDAIQATAVFSGQMNMSPPEINEKGYMKIIGSRHPILWRILMKESREGDLIPLDLEIGIGHSSMVISGSNAGGKTVALKTIGVITLMALSGMHIPAGSGTVIPFLKDVLADIGDEQSIEQNLSTFSAHITRISEIIRQSGPNTLVIIDELGTGTDPEQGGALSCAILRKLKHLGALTLISTHLGMLKAFAHSEPGIINAAMEMAEVSINDVPTYRPTYRLVMGEPGTSHAFEIAESLGLDADVIREARDLIRDEGGRVESLITELKHKAGELDRRLKEMGSQEQEARHLRSRLEEEHSRLKATEKENLARAFREAEEIIRKTRKEARDIIEKLKRADLARTGEIIKEIDRQLEDIVSTRKQYEPEKKQHIKEIKEGQRVFVGTLKKHGVVHSINKKTRRCKVTAEGKEIEVPFGDLFEPVEEFVEKQTKGRRDERSFAPSSLSEHVYIPIELNVIGQRVDPALSLIERFLNDASMAGHERVRIVHGVGTGILAGAIREYLRDHPLVESFRKGNEDEGGVAVTVVLLLT